MCSKIEMSLDDMELFFQKSLSQVRCRPKRVRKDSKVIRSGQRQRLAQLTAEIKVGKLKSVTNFLASVLRTGADDEGTPV